MLLLLLLLFSASLGHGRLTDQVVVGTRSLWDRVLLRVSNGTGQVGRDPLLERQLATLFNEVVRPKIANGEAILNTQMDPVWLFPLGPLEIHRRDFFKGSLNACNLYLHNMKASLKSSYFIGFVIRAIIVSIVLSFWLKHNTYSHSVSHSFVFLCAVMIHYIGIKVMSTQ